MFHFFAFCLLWLPFQKIETSQREIQLLQSDTCRTGKDTLTGRKVYLNGDSAPECEGGTAAWLRHVNKTLNVNKLPPGEIQSRYVIAFIVEKDGTISGERAVNTTKNDITKQLFAAVRTMRWIPGKCHGKTVAMLHTLPIIIDYGSK
jgi:hypothetical protein